MLDAVRLVHQQHEDRGDTSSQFYRDNAASLEQLEKEIGHDWDGTLLKDNEEFEVLPNHILKAANLNDIKRVIRWIKSGDNVQDRVNAKNEVGCSSLLLLALINGHYDLASTLLQLGANVNAKDSSGCSPLTLALGMVIISTHGNEGIKVAKLLLEWSGEIESPFTKEEYIYEIKKVSQSCHYSLANPMQSFANLLQSRLGGRRCEILNMTNHAYLNGKTCVTDKYLPETNHYEVTIESSKELLTISAENLKRRDRTPEECGYFIELKHGRTVRRDFASKEDCQAFLASFDGENNRPATVDAEAEARADQAAAALLAELDIEEEEGVTTKGSASKTSKSTKKKKSKSKMKRK